MDVSRIVEIASIFLFLLCTAVLFGLTAASSPPALQHIEDPSINVYAYSMPNQGWAPLTVYFSAYGSSDPDGRIVRYEWDLDGNGLFDTDATEADGYTQYTYAKPGEYLVSVRVFDDQGNSATTSTVVLVRHPASSSVDYWSVFDDSRVRRVDILVDHDDWQRMWADPPAKVEIPADAVVFGERLNNVGFRMRGQFSLRESGEKKPWKINTDAYVEGQEFHNLRQLMFINNIGDPSMLQEKLAYDVMHFAGVPASFVCFVEVWIDFTDDNEPSIFWGVYTMVERVDKKFLANRFGQDSKGGNLYKASHALRGPMDLVYYGPKIEDYPTQDGLYAYGKAANEEAADYSDIINLCYVIDGVDYATPEDFAQALEQVFNVDGFLRYMAVVITLTNWDIYPYTGNNYYLFSNASTGKFEWIPWDLSWGGNPHQSLFELEEFRLSEHAPLYERVFEVERYRQDYAAYLDLLNRHWFTYDNIFNQAKTYHDLIAPYVAQETGDKMYFGDTAMFSIEIFNESWMDLARFAGERNEFIRTSLSQDQ